MAKGTKTLNSAIKVDDDGNVYMTGNTEEPADEDIADGEVVYWIDVSGTPTLKVKAGSGSGVVSGDVCTLS